MTPRTIAELVLPFLFVNLFFDLFRAGICQRSVSWSIRITCKLRRPTAFWSRRIVLFVKWNILWPLVASWASWKHAVVGASLLNCLSFPMCCFSCRYCWIFNTSFTALCEVDIQSSVKAFAGHHISSIWIFISILKICTLLSRVCGLELWIAELSNMCGIYKRLQLSLSPCCKCNKGSKVFHLEFFLF